MKKFIVGILTGFIPFIIAFGIAALVVGLAYMFTLVPSWVLYTFVGILFVALLYIIGDSIRNT